MAICDVGAFWESYTSWELDQEWKVDTEKVLENLQLCKSHTLIFLVGPAILATFFSLILLQLSCQLY